MDSCVLFLLVCLAGLAGVRGQQQQLVTNACLRCLCREVTRCNLTRECSNGDCGMFAITRVNWVDAGSPATVYGRYKTEYYYENCATNYDCAVRTVQNYAARYPVDCNGDGKITCYDQAAVHFEGPYSCNNRYAVNFARSVERCLPQKEKNLDRNPSSWIMRNG